MQAYFFVVCETIISTKTKFAKSFLVSFRTFLLTTEHFQSMLLIKEVNFFDYRRTHKKNPKRIKSYTARIC